MSRRAPSRRARPARRSWLGLLLLALLAPAVPAAGQVRPDTVAPDTVRPDTVRGDTVPRDTAVVSGPGAQVEPDTLPRDSTAAPPLPATVPRFPRFARPRPTGFAAERWEWDRSSLDRYQALSVLDLLVEIPGLTITRSGDFGSPAGLSSLGQGGARVRVFLDGFELDPLGSSTPDLQRYPLTDLDAVVVERAAGEVRVELHSFRVSGPQPYSIVEAAAGAYHEKGLHGLLSRGVGSRSVVTAAYDLVSTGGFISAPYGVSAKRVEWAYALSRRTSFRAEYRTESLQRSSGPYPMAAGERLLLVRGRSEVLPGLSLEAALGRRSRAPDDADPLNVDLSSTQGLLRAALDTDHLWGEAGVRSRTHAGEDVGAAAGEAYASAGLAPTPWLTASGEARTSSWAGEGGLAWSASGRLGAATGPALFATFGGGTRALALVSDSTTYVERPPVDSVEVVDTVMAPVYRATSSGVGELRLGGEWVGDGARVGLAALTLAGGRAVPFGLGFDPMLAAVDVGAARGIEARAALPLTRGGGLRLDAWYDHWLDRGGRPYLPAQQGRAALTLHGLFFGGELEPTFRLEVEQRGPALAPAEGSADLSEVPGYALGHFYMQLRILDIRAFFRYDNLFNDRFAQDLPFQYLPGTRLYWGVRWVFRG